MEVLPIDRLPTLSQTQNPAAVPIRRRKARLQLFALAIVLAAALATLGPLLLERIPAEPLPVLFDAPRYSWTNQHQQVVSSDDLRGKVVLANFIFTRCTDICPTWLMPKMRDVRNALQDAGLLGSEVVLVSFSVDPEHDTPEVLANYGRRFGVEGEHWHLLTSGNDGGAEVQRVVVRGFYLPVEHVDADHAHNIPDQIVHSGRFILVDPQQRVRALYLPEDIDPAAVVGNVRQLVAEKQD